MHTGRWLVPGAYVFPECLDDSGNAWWSSGDGRGCCVPDPLPRAPHTAPWWPHQGGSVCSAPIQVTLSPRQRVTWELGQSRAPHPRRSWSECTAKGTGGSSGFATWPVNK